ncbi:MAG: hypothetical protein FWB90_00270 [Fibromonadales bacterium]|nr:hypothetical protein [Fibromonadales bacterium]
MSQSWSESQACINKPEYLKFLKKVEQQINAKRDKSKGLIERVGADKGGHWRVV